MIEAANTTILPSPPPSFQCERQRLADRFAQPPVVVNAALDGQRVRRSPMLRDKRRPSYLVPGPVLDHSESSFASVAPPRAGAYRLAAKLAAKRDLARGGQNDRSVAPSCADGIECGRCVDPGGRCDRSG